MSRVTVVLAMALLLEGLGGLAQGPEKNPLKTDRNPLATVKRLKCTFTVASIGSWKGDEAAAELKSAQDVLLDIEEIDADGGTARMGQDHVTTLLTVSSLHFMNRTLQGSLNVTTVFSQKNPAGRFRAVRSGHDYLPTSIPGFTSTPNVSQHYGDCEASQ
jgi:hypothetical protein